MTPGLAFIFGFTNCFCRSRFVAVAKPFLSLPHVVIDREAISRHRPNEEQDSRFSRVQEGSRLVRAMDRAPTQFNLKMHLGVEKAKKPFVFMAPFLPRVVSGYWSNSIISPAH